MRKKRVLITGALGFIGNALVSHFLDQGCAVFGVDRYAGSARTPLKPSAQFQRMELPSSEFKSLLTQWKPDALIHCAGRSSVPQAMLDPRSDYEDGPRLTFELLNTLKEFSPTCAFLFLSSAAVYGNPLKMPISEIELPRPLSTYGYHKWQSELICQEFASVYGMQAASARIFSAYGRGLKRQVLWDLVNKALNHAEVKLQGTGQESRDFIHVEDIARGLSTILERAPMSGDVYNLASGIETKIVDLCSMIQIAIGTSKKVVFAGEAPNGTPRNWRANISKLSSFGFSPSVNFEEGVKSFAGWAREEINTLKAGLDETN
ncbi:MAG: SDR family oxidoreductase [Anaerolineales bacterium]|nr:SDR family oxidoreductase [Anaerolineales bacterium]